MKICPACRNEIVDPWRDSQIFCCRACVNRYHKRKFPAEYGCRSRLYRIWRAMSFRCHQPSHKAFARYSAKGIEVCREWLSSYSAFAEWAVANGYADEFEIDRIDNARGYEPNNCRWVTRSENQRNRDNSLAAISALGEAKTPIEWSEDPRCAATYSLLMKRLKSGWAPETAIVTPSQFGGKRPISMRSRTAYCAVLAPSDPRCQQ